MSTAKTYDTLHTVGINATRSDLTPMVSQFLSVKNQYPGIILFYRMGDFYETFFEDALITARVLEITLTGRDAGPLGRIPMAGIPVKAVDAYVGKLMAQNLQVAICEQLDEGPEKTKIEKPKLMTRKVVRVLSSGTVTEQSLLKPQENNFLAALYYKPGDTTYGFAYGDITTGELAVTELSYPQLLSELDRIQPVEMLVPGRLKKGDAENPFDTIIPDVPQDITDQWRCTALNANAFDKTHTTELLKTLLQVNSLDGFDLAELPNAVGAAGVMAHYIREHFPENPPAFDGIKRYSLNQTITLNMAARRNLELLSTVKGNQYEGSLLWVLNRTCTSMGARLLRQWITQPLTHLPEIHSRLESVEELVKSPSVRESLRQVLPDVYDMERLGMKIANLTAQPRDLLALKQSIAKLPSIANLLKAFESFYLLRMKDFPPELFKAMAQIDQAIDDAPGMSIKDGGIIKAGYHQELDQLRELVSNHEAWLREYEETQRTETGIKTLKISFNSAFGYFIEVTRNQASAVPSHYHRKQTLTNAERYTTETLKQHEAQVLDAQSRQFDLEYSLFIELRQKLLPYAAVLKDCAQRVAALDVLLSFATVAVDQHFVKPTVDDSLELNIQQGRHPVVEKMLPMGRFVPNACLLSATEKEFQIPQLMMITGPNMAGKSTYMRQVALIVLLAQIGSFVPAAYARIGFVDGIYTRVGAVDDLSSGQSTFMVEMNETSQILHGGTRRSLVLLDEVGRGTSTFDGIAIAWSVSEYLVNKIGCRTLFATHYHELNALEESHPKIQNYRVVVSESGASGEIAFLHTVEPGAAQKSYGIQVAKMAGIPNEVVVKATGILNQFQKKEKTALANRSVAELQKTALAQESPQLNLF